MPGLVAERTSALHAEVLHHRDLHTLDVLRFQIGSRNELVEPKNSRFSIGVDKRYALQDSEFSIGVFSSTFHASQRLLRSFVARIA